MELFFWCDIILAHLAPQMKNIWRPTGKEVTKLQFRGVQTFKPGPFWSECSDRAGTGFNRKVRNFCIEALNNFFFQFQKKYFFRARKKNVDFFLRYWILVRVSIVNPIRIYYRNPHQKPKGTEKCQHFFQKRPRKFLNRSWKKKRICISIQIFLLFPMVLFSERFEHSILSN